MLNSLRAGMSNLCLIIKHNTWLNNLSEFFKFMFLILGLAPLTISACYLFLSSFLKSVLSHVCGPYSICPNASDMVNWHQRHATSFCILPMRHLLGLLLKTVGLTSHSLCDYGAQFCKGQAGKLSLSCFLPLKAPVCCAWRSLLCICRGPGWKCRGTNPQRQPSASEGWRPADTNFFLWSLAWPTLRNIPEGL